MKLNEVSVAMYSDKEYAIRIYCHVFNSNNHGDCDVVGVFNAVNKLAKMERIILNRKFRYEQSNEQIALCLRKNADHIEKIQTETLNRLRQSSFQRSMSISLKSNEITAKISVDELGLSPYTTYKLMQSGLCTGGDILGIIPFENERKSLRLLFLDAKVKGELFKKLELLGHDEWVLKMIKHREQSLSKIIPVVSNFKSPFNFSRDRKEVSTITFLCECFGYVASDITDSELFVRNYIYNTITRSREFYSYTYSWKLSDFSNLPCVLDVEPIDFLCDKLKIERESIQDDVLFIRNYIFLTANARKHLMEIKKRISVLKLEGEQVPNETKDYAKERREYFIGKNKKAQKEVEHWLKSKVNFHLESLAFSDDLINEGLNSLLHRVYSYYYENEQHDPEYDFSTVAKFTSIVLNKADADPNDPLKYFRQKDILTEKFIRLKKTDAKLYKSELISYVQDNHIFTLIDECPKVFYHVKERMEIFNSLADLLNEKRYSTFCVLAILQIEGLFNDYLSMNKSRSESNFGGKIDVSLKDDVRFRDIYSYFRYDVKVLRNEVAHSGILKTDDAELTVYELILDLFCIINILSMVFSAMFEPFFFIAAKIYDEDCTRKEEEILTYLWENQVLLRKEFWSVLANPFLYDEEMKHFRPDDITTGTSHLCEIAHDISLCVLSKEFWMLVLDECKDNPNIDKEFMQTLMDELEPNLDIEAKNLCIAVKAIIDNL